MRSFRASVDVSRRLAGLLIPLFILGLYAPAAAASDASPLGAGVVVEPRDMIARGDDIFFRAVDASTKIGLFVSDGTPGGTRLLAGGQGDSNGLNRPENLVRVGPFVYLAAKRNGGFTELYRADGTLDGTVRVTDMSGGALDVMIYTGGNLFFNLNTGFTGSGREPWASNGTPAGTRQLRDIYPGSRGSNPQSFAVLGSSAMFDARSPDEGTELWISDGTPGGTTLVLDVYPGSWGSQPQALFSGLGKVFFFARTLSLGRQPWVSDGTPGGTVQLATLFPNTGFLAYPDWTEAIGKVFFIAQDQAVGYEPWVSDGTPAGTRMLIDVNPADDGPWPRLLGEFAGNMWFIADDGTNDQLWSSDGTTAGTVPVFTFDRGATDRIPRQPGVVFDERLYFAAWSAGEGVELWATDGTPGGTGLVLDALPGAASSYPADLAAVGSLLTFGAGPDGSRSFWAQPASDFIFWDGFESGDASRWVTETQLGGTLAYAAAAAGRGETGMEVALGAGNERAFVTDESPDDEDVYRVRFRFDPNSLTLAENKRVKIISSRADTGQRLFQALVRWRAAEGFALRVKAHRNDLSWAGTGWHPLADDWSVLEIEWRRASAPGAADGSLKLWIDDLLIEEVAGIDNDLWPTGWVQWGIVGGVQPGTAGSLYFDDFQSWRSPRSP